MREWFVVSKFNQGRYLWMPVVSLFAFISIGTAADQPVKKSVTPGSTLAKKQIFKPGTPEAAVAAMMESDFSRVHRHAKEQPLFRFFQRQGVSPTYYFMFSNCPQYVLIRSYKILGGAYDSTQQVSASDSSRVYHVVVEVEMLALGGAGGSGQGWWGSDRAAKDTACGWAGLEVFNRVTGETEHHGDVVVTNEGAWSTGLAKFGKVVKVRWTTPSGWLEPLVIDADRRRWRFRVPVVREKTGWVYASPFAPAHYGIEAEIQDSLNDKNLTMSTQDTCLGKGKPFHPQRHAVECTSDRLTSMRTFIVQTDSVIMFLKSLRDAK